MDLPDNPLLEIQFHVPFDRIKPEHVEPAVRQLLSSARKELERIASDPAPRTYENTLVELDEFTRNLDYAMNVVRHLESVATCPELRAAYNTVHPLTSEFYSNIPLHEGLWNNIKRYAETSEARGLKGTRNRYLTKTLQEFRRHGADLDAAGKARLARIEVELAQLTTKFAENVLDTTNGFELVVTDEAKLAGLPPAALEAARQNAAKKGIEGWRFTLQAPSYLPVMTYLDDRGIREHMYRAYVTRGTAAGFDNQPIIERILELRREKAALIGFQDFADFVLADRMAHTGDRAESFLESLKDKTLEHFRRENDELAAFRRSLEGEMAPDLEPWDIGYYAEKQRAALYDFDEEDLRPYFPLPRVVEGMFEIFGRLLGIRVTEESGVPVWDAGVRYFEIRDTASGEFLGAFYGDFYPRENKRGGAWMDALITGVQTPKGLEPHLGLICGNLTPPVGDAPALLTHREVETIFHEFGHLLHHCLSRVEVRGLAGTNIAWDFVELPSQIMENWCWERESLDLFARHYQTGEPIPGDLFQKMRRARTFRAANGQMRQLSFGLLDFALHRRYSKTEHGGVIAYSRAILQEFSPAPLPPEHAMISSFTHLFANPVGYAAGYYSYKWAEVLDADAFTRFQNEGVFNPQTGAEYRTKILERGDSDDPMLLFRSFMGRDPDPNALLARLGLAG
ncbi:MAG: M3 family metallopeptidase [Bryobacterales bacterium]|nr:M3 family metallopeptidase [Bryobacterales bacterium]